MALNKCQIKQGPLLICFLFFSVCEGTLGPTFMMTFPAILQSGTEAKLCASLLKPNETLTMTVSLVHNNESRTLFQERAQEDFHHCFLFQTPVVQGESVQRIKVVVQGETFHWMEERKIVFKSFHPPTFIQTDKPIYLPGQTVHFRIVTMDNNFIPFIPKCDIVALEDSKANRIAQWVNISSSNKILQLSHQLNPEGHEGTYNVIASIGERTINHHFEVKQYTLPKFEVKLNSPEEVSVAEEELKIEVCGKYTFGQPVAGEVWMKVCRKVRRYHHAYHIPEQHRPTQCLNETLELKENGCATLVFGTRFFFNAAVEQQWLDSLKFNVKITEEGTGITMSKSGTVGVSYVLGKASFVETPDVFKHGSVIEGKIKATHFNGTPISNKEVYVLERKGWSTKELFSLTTDINGMAHFSINTTDRPAEDIQLVASVSKDISHRSRTPHFEYQRKDITLYRPATPDTPYVPRHNALTIEGLKEPLACETEIPVTIRYTFFEDVEDSVDLIYLTLSKGVIVHYGAMKAAGKKVDGVISGKVSFNLPVSTEISPVVQILAYCVLSNETVIVETKNFKTEKCFKNKVSLQFSPTKAVPAEENTLQLSAEPGSLCGLSVVDKSVLILEPGKGLDTEKIFNLLPVTSLSDYPDELEDILECPHVKSNDYAHDVFRSVGLKMATNLEMRKPPCLMDEDLDYYDEMTGSAFDPDVETARSFFPETWIWKLIELGESGSAQLPVTVPDTITTWETEAFCLSSKGFGLAAPAELTVFQPFFLELSLPYSIIRGELFELKATVFNYLSKSIMVKVTPAPSSDYTLKPSSDGQYSSCLHANGRKTFRWTLIPSVLGVLNVTVSAEAEASQSLCDNEIVTVPDRGRIDTVTRTLLVKAEGTERTETHSWLLCPREKVLTEEVELTLPENVVEGSSRASVSVLGDILGRALQNLDGLLKMPYGCGEQNMALLSPNIYILQYLQSTEQLTSAIREKATGFLKSGYQRQLNYKHFDGAYSTFGDGEGNTWLTAFVLRSFGKAQSYIFIDPQTMASARQWLLERQQPDGCFESKGNLFNNRMKGGVNDNVTMTAYITASFLELNISAADPAVTKGLSCLRASISNLSNTYTTALLAYTFSLAGEKETRAQLLQKLEGEAFSEAGRLSWSQSNSEHSDSLAVEISSYVLLAVLTNSPLSAADLGYASRIVNWLVRQQNPYGGFSSTQDTVVALQALALYATRVFGSGGSSTMIVETSGGNRQLFDVNQSNKLLYQEKALQDIPGKYSVKVEGSACVSVQMALFYNIPTSAEKSAFTIEAKTEGNCKNPLLLFNIQYNGAEDQTNMAIVDAKILSGFMTDRSNVMMLTHSEKMERIDIKDDHVIIYLEEVPKATVLEFCLQLQQILPIKNLKPALIKVYDYYQTSDQSETEYSYHCA
ncbi:alpha-2-macroglobulin [Chanos chanos]|uniref:Alpha-2-macroglobulin n=1 Tax=Chanos chanos TaxID=29144 RepID=A0A6J2VJ46_CHACN|nr:alpha-2-macroglobulin-like [Chanos chanos]